MQLTVLRPTTITADAIRVVVPVRYGTDDIPADFPFRKGETWDVTIDLDTGVIRDWPAGFAFDVDMKVVDEGNYYLLDGPEIIAKIEQDYVPACIPNRWSDYIDFQIGSDGKIAGWRATPQRVQESFFPVE